MVILLCVVIDSDLNTRMNAGGAKNRHKTLLKVIGQPTAKPAAKPSPKPAAKPTPKPAAKPVAKPAVKPVDKVAGGPAAQVPPSVADPAPPSGAASSNGGPSMSRACPPLAVSSSSDEADDLLNKQHTPPSTPPPPSDSESSEESDAKADPLLSSSSEEEEEAANPNRRGKYVSWGVLLGPSDHKLLSIAREYGAHAPPHGEFDKSWEQAIPPILEALKRESTLPAASLLVCARWLTLCLLALFSERRHGADRLEGREEAQRATARFQERPELGDVWQD